jgi:tripartite-type tricarboxylate transporter receptor subunit TctC
MTPMTRLLAGVGLALAVNGSAEAKDLTMYVGYPPGGSFDSYVRTIAKHLTGHLPGAPNIIVKYIPGGGSRKLAEYLATVAPKDGSEFGQLNRSILFNELLTGEKEDTDPSRFAFIGSPSDESQNCVVWAASPIKSLDDAKKQEVMMSVTGAASADVAALVMANKVLGTKFKPVPGYQGGAEQNLAIERGEVAGRCWTWGTAMATKSDWVKDGKLRFLFQASLKGSPHLPGVPVFGDLVKDPIDRQALAVVFADQEIGHPIVAPPGTALDAVAALRNAFAATMKDPAFRADAASAKLEINPISGDEIATMVRDVHAAPKPVIDRARNLIKVQ